MQELFCGGGDVPTFRFEMKQVRRPKGGVRRLGSRVQFVFFLFFFQFFTSIVARFLVTVQKQFF